MGLSQFEEHEPWITQLSFDDAASLVPFNFLSGLERSLRIDSLILTSDDTVDNQIAFWAFFDATPATLLGTITVPAGAGFDGTISAVEAVRILFPSILGYYGFTHYGFGCAPLAVPSSGKHLYVTAIGGYF